MITLDGPMLAGLAALITSVATLITTLQAGRIRQRRRQNTPELANPPE